MTTRKYKILCADEYESAPLGKLGWFYGFDEIEQSTDLYPTYKACQTAIDSGEADWYYTHGE